MPRTTTLTLDDCPVKVVSQAVSARDMVKSLRELVGVDCHARASCSASVVSAVMGLLYATYNENMNAFVELQGIDKLEDSPAAAELLETLTQTFTITLYEGQDEASMLEGELEKLLRRRRSVRLYRIWLIANHYLLGGQAGKALRLVLRLERDREREREREALRLVLRLPFGRAE